MATPMKIRAKMMGDFADIRVLMQHPMETGQRKDGAGKLIPAHFIQQVSIDVAGKRVLEGETNTSVSKNPLVAVRVRGVKAGDKVVASWVDNKGEKRTDEDVIAG